MCWLALEWQSRCSKGGWGIKVHLRLVVVTDLFCKDLTQFSGDTKNSTDQVAAYTIETDGQWGPYLYCNPVDPDAPHGDWDCSVCGDLVFARRTRCNRCGAAPQQPRVAPEMPA